MSTLAADLRKRLSSGGSYLLALVVGTLINAYGHFLVPWLQGETQLLGRFAAQWGVHPGTTAFSVLVAYLFPLLVGVYSSVAARHELRGTVGRAQFPDAKPDPVFRANLAGQLVDMGAETRRQFETLGVRTAQQVLGSTLWTRLRDAQARGDRLPAGTTLWCEPAGARFVLSHASGPEGTINVYLARARGDGASSQGRDA